MYKHYIDGHYEVDVFKPLQILNKWINKHLIVFHQWKRGFINFNSSLINFKRVIS